jgi:hypothetical protein
MENESASLRTTRLRVRVPHRLLKRGSDVAATFESSKLAPRVRLPSPAFVIPHLLHARVAKRKGVGLQIRQTSVRIRPRALRRRDANARAVTFNRTHERRQPRSRAASSSSTDGLNRLRAGRAPCAVTLTPPAPPTERTMNCERRMLNRRQQAFSSSFIVHRSKFKRREVPGWRT